MLDRHPALTIENCGSGGMRQDYAMLSRALDELAEHAREGRIDRLLVVLKNMVPEYVANAEAKRTVPRGA